VEVERAYVRVPSRLPTLVRAVPVPAIDQLIPAMRDAAAIAAATAKSYGALVASLHPKKQSDRLVKRRYALQRQAALVEGARLGKPATCRCIFAMVVRGDVSRLAALARLSQVRVVDPTSPVIPLAGLTVLPLPPEVRTVVPRDSLRSG
jgi:hypothetical protein